MMARIGQTITPRVAQFLMTPAPNLPPPPSGLNYEVKMTPAGEPYRTGNLIPTNRTTTTVIDNPAFDQFIGFGGIVAGIAGGEAIAALPAAVSKVAPAVISHFTGGGLPPWVSSIQSLTPGAAFSTARSAALKTFLAGQLRQLLARSTLVSRLDTTSRASYLTRVRALYQLYTRIR
jgi:hypothetical protein